ncbi:hypothetical protein VB774_23145 [Pseudanabaena galeata UHCC 0370]|uniref:Transposase n=1 Tax=Pseudanabaena galeata UHCC 0370 TaxID=3110310 RepID=A0ABU5TQI8_9CYAN|nr:MULTISPECIES: hypothetical protein [Pseudanabaena]MEA5480542.1 hypothetical protein [Pseudanabaena galeata UHCC 0370]MEA5489983.1 hypothetical protein [Pseudanabaena sp. CCNP1317]
MERLTTHDLWIADILEGIEADIAQVSADGAYDHRHCYDEIAQHGAKALKMLPMSAIAKCSSKLLINLASQLLNYKPKSTVAKPMRCYREILS